MLKRLEPNLDPSTLHNIGLFAMNAGIKFNSECRNKMNQMYERLKIQANIRRLIDEYGLDTALELYRKAIEREMRYVDLQIELKTKDNSAPS
jgi:hypothetical protein